MFHQVFAYPDTKVQVFYSQFLHASGVSQSFYIVLMKVKVSFTKFLYCLDEGQGQFHKVFTSRNES
jgi:hypothetical protein